MLKVSPSPPSPVAPWEWAVVVVATLVGAVIRFWGLDAIPPGLWYDEAIYALDGLAIARGERFPIFLDTYGHMREPLYAYLLAPGIWLGGTTAYAVRAVSAVIGVATIPAVWWMARRLFGPSVAIFTLLFFVPMRWHVHFSRTAFRVILSPFFAAMIVAALAGYLQQPDRKRAAGLGALLAASLYTYLSMRLMIVIALVGIVMGRPWRERLPDFRGEMLALGIVFALVFAPLGINYSVNPQHFGGRTGEISLLAKPVDNAPLILRQARDIALMGIVRGDHEAKHNIPGSPRFNQAYLLGSPADESVAMWQDAQRAGDAPDVHGTGYPVFDLLTGLVFYAGIVLLLVRVVRRRCWASGFLLVWMAVGSLVSVLSFGAPNMLRLLFLAPMAALVLGLATDQVAEYVSQRLKQPVRRAWVLGLVGLLPLWFLSGELTRYHGIWARHPEVPEKFNARFVDAARLLATTMEPGDEGIVPEFLLNHPAFRFEADSILAQVVTTPGDAVPPRRVFLVTDPRYAPPLLIEPDWLDDARAVESLTFPDGTTWAVLFEMRGR